MYNFIKFLHYAISFRASAQKTYYLCRRLRIGEYAIRSDELCEEKLMQPVIGGQLGVKRGGEEVPLPRGDDPPISEASKNLRLTSDRVDERRTDKNTPQGGAAGP